MTFTPLSKEKRIWATLFPMKADRDLEFKLRVLKVVERLPQDAKRAERLNQVAGELWRSVLKCPVKPFRVKETPCFLVPEEKAGLADGYSFIGPANREYHLKLTDETINVDLSESKLDHRDIVCDMLVRSFSDKFMRLQDKFWRWHWTLFYKNRSENSDNANRLVDAFRGIKFSVVWLDDLGLHLAADIRTKYMGRKSLREHLESGDTKFIKDHLKTEKKGKADPGSLFIRDNEIVKYSCLYAGQAGEPAEKATFIDTDGRTRTVYEYYLDRFKIRLPPNDLVVYVKSSEHGDPIPAPSSRLFPAFDTEQIKKMHESLRAPIPPSPQIPPQKRVEMITEFLHDVRKVRFGDAMLTLEPEPISERQQYFIPPDLLFGK